MLTLARSPARGTRPTPHAGSAFIRLLAALNGDGPAPAPKDTYAERLSRWFDWKNAIALSAALSAPPGAGSGARPLANANANADEGECRRVRASLVQLITEDDATADDGFAPHRARYAAAQQAMEARIGPLRRRLRATLAATSPALARLAALDAVMETVVGAQERVLLATVPRWLAQRHEALGQAQGEPADAAAALDGFRHELRELLLAELELRMQPVDGLLDALHTPPSDRHE